MFGVLCVSRVRPPFWRRLLLRLFPTRGLSRALGSYGMAAWRLAAVALPEGLPARACARRVEGALRELRAAGVRRLVVPDEHRAAAKALGFAPVLPAHALRACAARAVLLACAAAGLPAESCCVLVCAERVDRTLSDELLTLARTVRTLRLCCTEPAPILRGRLLAARGVASEGPPPQGAPVLALYLGGPRPPRADLAVDLSVDLSGGTEGWSCPSVTPRAILPPDARARLPEGADEGAFLSALLLCGGLSPREIGLDIPPCAPYNKESQ